MRIEYLWIYTFLTCSGFIFYFGWKKIWAPPFVLACTLVLSIDSQLVWLLSWVLMAISGVLLAWTTVKESGGREREVTRIVLQFLLGALLVVLLKNEDLRNYPVIIVVITGFILLLSSYGLELAHSEYPLYSFVTRGMPLLIWAHKLQKIQNVFTESHMRTILVVFGIFQSIYVVLKIFRKLPDFSTLKRETLLTRQVYVLTLFCFAFGPTEAVWIVILSLWVVLLLLSELPRAILLAALILPAFLPSFITQVVLAAVSENPVLLACVGFVVLVFQLIVLFNLFNPKRKEPILTWRSGGAILLLIAGIFLNRWTLGVLPLSIDQVPWINADALSEINNLSNFQVFGMNLFLFSIGGFFTFLLVKFIKSTKKNSSRETFSNLERDVKNYFVLMNGVLVSTSQVVFPRMMHWLADRVSVWVDFLNQPLSYFSLKVANLKGIKPIPDFNISILDKWNISLIVYLLMGLWFSSLG